MAAGFRTERDTMGEMRVPEGALYGAQTARAVENFPISSYRLQREFLRALGLVKAAAARVNGRHGWVSPEKTAAIEAAALEVANGGFDSQFVVDVFQTGSGTSTNMNVNEVIAHVASAHGVGVHANDDVNHGQSSNDVIPTAIHVSAAEAIHTRLFPALGELEQALLDKSREFDSVIKIGRTHLQDAVPMRLGQEFGGYARQVALSRERITAALAGIYELPLGGTAVGTGLNAPKGFATEVIRELAQETGLPFREAADHFEAQGAKDAVCFLSGALRNCAISLIKIANDIRWLGSGPRCGLGELRLPAVQPGSSIMPGKVNPVIAESLLMACAQVIGYDATICYSASSNNFELNVMMPVMAYDLLESISLLSASSRNFARRLVSGLEVDRERTASFVERSLAMGTVLAPEIGYDRAAALVKEAYRTDRTVREVARAQSGIPSERLDEILDPESQTR